MAIALEAGAMVVPLALVADTTQVIECPLSPATTV
jgi:hypothetical protein